MNTQVETIDGAKFSDINGLRDYLLAHRQHDFVRQFCRKLLGFALARQVQLSDGPLLAEMEAQLAKNEYHVQTALLAVVQSPQFRMKRGLDSPLEQHPAP